MQAALNFPEISPELLTIPLGSFELAIRWYALAYIVGIVIGWRLVIGLLRRPALWSGQTAPMDEPQLEALLTWIIVGVILGGRLGFVLFYQPQFYLENPGAILRIWEGGMAFHGGLMGVVVATAIYTWRNGLPFFSVSDALCAATPPGLFLGRIANFINAELWGRPSDAPWAVIFPGLDAQDCPGPEGLVERGGQILCARHPSQLYESGLEGLFLGLILLWLIVARRWLHRPGLITGAFFAGYGAARIFVEAFRQADPQFITPDNPWGHVIDLGPIGLTMGQVLSLPMLLFGLGVMATATLHRRANA